MLLIFVLFLSSASAWELPHGVPYTHCCDGSDEYEGLVKCESTCGALAAAVKQARSIKRVEVEEGHKKFKEYVEQLKVRLVEERIAAEKAAEEQARLAKEQAEMVTPAPEIVETEQPAPDVTEPSHQEEGSPTEKLPDSGDKSEHSTSETDIENEENPAHNENDEEEEEEHETSTPAPIPTLPPPPPKPIDYGPEQGFRMLEDGDGCLEHTDLKYIYRLCAFRDVTQRDLGSSGTHGVSLGKWSEWAYAEDDVGKVNNYAVMRFDRGQNCWNGPDRSTKIYVHCGAENELFAVAEPSRCEYEMHLRTPAACFEDPKVILNRLHPEED